MPSKRTVVHDFTDWSRGREGLEPDVIETLVEFKSDYLGDRSTTRWTGDQLEQLLLFWIPRKVVADADWVDAAVPTARAYVEFLRDTGRLDAGSDPAPELLARLDELSAEFVPAMSDQSRFGMAKSMFGDLDVDALGADLSPDVDGDLDDWLDDQLGEMDDELEPLPPIELPSEAELAGAARASLGTLDVDTLAAWVDEQTVSREWERYEKGSDDDVLAAWHGLFDELLEHAGDPVPGDEAPGAHQLVDELILIALPQLYAGHAVSYDATVGLVGAVLSPLDDVAADLGEPQVDSRDTVDWYLEPLLGMGAFSRDGDEVRMTALGKWGYRQIRLRDGGEAPLLADLRDFAAADLLSTLDDLGPDDATRAAEHWIAEQPDRTTAARDLLSAGSDGGASVRMTATSVVDELLDDVADAAYAELAGDELLAPYAAMQAAQRSGTEEPLPLETARWLAVDALLMLAETVPDDELRREPAPISDAAECLLDRTPPWPVRHPQALFAYEVIAELHPHGKSRKLAKRAIHQLTNPR